MLGVTITSKAPCPCCGLRCAYTSEAVQGINSTLSASGSGDVTDMVWTNGVPPGVTGSATIALNGDIVTGSITIVVPAFITGWGTFHSYTVGASIVMASATGAAGGSGGQSSFTAAPAGITIPVSGAGAWDTGWLCENLPEVAFDGGVNIGFSFGLTLVYSGQSSIGTMTSDVLATASNLSAGTPGSLFINGTVVANTLVQPFNFQMLRVSSNAGTMIPGADYQIVVPISSPGGIPPGIVGVVFTADFPTETVPFDAYYGSKGGPVTYEVNETVNLGTPCQLTKAA